MKIKKRGRPFGSVKDGSFVNRIDLKLNDEQFEILERLSEEWHMTKQGVLRSLIEDKRFILN